jgi:hypothetical protein
MTASAAARVKPVSLFTRAVFVLAALLAIIAGVQLYILTDHTDHFFAWTIVAPLSATFLGTGYWTGAALLLLSATERAWASIRVAVAAVGAFVPLMLLTTLLHLDKFHLFSTDTVAVIAAWAWMIVYFAVPFLVAGVLIIQWLVPGGDPPRQGSVPLILRALIAANALASLVLCLALFFFPGLMNTLWPWPLTALTSQAIASGFAAVVLASVWFIRENSWSRSRTGTVSYFLIGSLQLLAFARYAGTVQWGRPATWLYLLFMFAFFVGGLASTLAAWLPPLLRRVPA